LYYLGFGFGRKHVVHANAKLSEQFPEFEVRLEVFDRSVDIIQEGFNLEIRVSEDLPLQHVYKKLQS
jgi:LysR family transcriptional activator of dmlA